ncbi:hypothetical protein PGT21_030331 [Puccinia graminis f. sp. tritici]|uniref:Uncharacterized protein n=1 Tax=Puccinia graminis f. sp. tritici TaxID=56615 RepID=A0A5B0QCK6_PUCGR|nr:hypothetical protein PGT21_029261 [Puccinia graminis f. sp. tritici]KAA1110724.1 hypothetical protein PGT21_030331 [Puccinia graminis f. sp. tritici]
MYTVSSKSCQKHKSSDQSFLHTGYCWQTTRPSSVIRNFGALASGPDLSEHTLSLHLKIATNWNTEPDHSHQKRWHILPKLV